jgi:nucleotide-binding universal stress UspA family protein
MTVIAWVLESTWTACVDAARDHAAEDDEIVLLHVNDPDIPGLAHAAFTALLGRGGQPGHDPGPRAEDIMAASATELLAHAADRLGRPCSTVELTGRVEREVVAAAADAELLVVARDGDRHLGPRSLGPATRFVVDHAPCPVLLVWPEPAPGVHTIPPPPPHKHHHD